MILALLLTLHLCWCEEEVLAPSLILFTVNDCEDCNDVDNVWSEIEELGGDILIDEINCDYQEEACHKFQVTTFPSILFVANSGIREFDDDFTVENVKEFVESSIAVLIHGENDLTEEEELKVFLDEEDLDILGRTNALVYFMYDEEPEAVEEFIITLRGHLQEEFDIAVYVVPCGTMTDICVGDPFFVTDLPCVKYLGETIYSYKGEITVEKLEKWLKIKVFRTEGEVGNPLHFAEEDEDDDDDEDEDEDEDEEEELAIDYSDSGMPSPTTQQDTTDKTVDVNKELTYLTTKTYDEAITETDAVLIAYLDKNNTNLEAVFKELHDQHRDVSDILICVVRCDENPKVCKTIPNLPAVKHGFMGKMIRTLDYRTVEELASHIEKLKMVLENGREILKKEEKETGEVGSSAEEEAGVDEEEAPGVLILTAANWNRTLASNRMVFVKFFVPWCGHCQKLKPTWKLLGDSFKTVTDIVIGMLNCQNDKPICKQYLVSSYPTLFVFIKGEQAHRYRDTRALNNFIEFTKEKYYISVEDDLKYDKHPFQLTGTNLWNILGTRKYTVVLFTAVSCDTCSDGLTQFSKGWDAVRQNPALLADIMLATISCDKDIELCGELGISRVPFITVFEGDKELSPDKQIADGLIAPFRKLQAQLNTREGGTSMKMIQLENEALDAMRSRLNARATRSLENEDDDEMTIEDEAEEIADEEASLKKTAPPKEESVMELGTDTFKSQLQKTRYTFVKFFAPWCGHCRKLAPIWDKLGEDFFNEDEMVLAKINCDTQEKLCDKFKIATYPTLIMFVNDIKMKYTCKKRKEDDLREFIRKFLDEELPLKEDEGNEQPEKKLSEISKGVITLNSASLETIKAQHPFVFVKFYATWCPHCQKLAPTWDRIGDLYLDEDIVIARVDCDKDDRLCNAHQVRSYPTLIMFDNVSGTQHVCRKRGEYELTTYIDSFVEKGKGLKKDEL